MTFETRRRLGLCAALLLGAAGCDKGSVGEFGETEGQSSGATEGPSSGASESATSGPGSAGSSSGGMTTVGPTSTTLTTSEGSSDSGELLDVGDAGFCENPEHGCSGPADCGDNCGSLDSMFDENGCVRVACGLGQPTCEADEFCYRPQDYGGCQSSDVSCTESADGTCGCGLDPDCGGAYCVPEDIVFGGIVPGPTVGLVSNGCGPADEVLSVFTLGTYASDACGGAFDPGPLLTISVELEFETVGTTLLAQAEYSTDGTVETTQTAQSVVLRITEWDSTVSGDYEVLLEDDTLLVGTFESVVSCASDIICG